MCKMREDKRKSIEHMMHEKDASVIIFMGIHPHKNVNNIDA